ncbi:MAG: ABC transporter ATP-binding protein [Candidatus Methanomethylophilus sp.]|nr:ABC transporter ATP-binding protein [Methanomethylophilus sp.]
MSADPYGPVPSSPAGPRWARRTATKNLNGAVRRLFRYMGSCRHSVLLGIVFALLSSALALIGPQYLEQITDLIAGSIRSETAIDLVRIGRIVLLLLALYVFSILFSYLQHLIVPSASQRLANKLRQDLSAKLDRLPLSYFTGSNTGDLMSRLTNDADTIGESFGPGITMFISSLTMVTGALIMMVYTDPRMALVAAAPGMFGFLLIFGLVRRSQPYFIGQQRDLGALNGLVQEVYYALDIVRAYGGERTSKDRFTVINERLWQSGFRARFISGMMPRLMGFVNNLGYVTVCVFGSMMIIDGSIGYGVIVAFIVYVEQFTHPIGQIADSFSDLQSVGAAAERVFEVLDAPEMDPEPDAVALPSHICGEVEFRDVRFSYVPGQEIIHGFSQHVAAGQKIAIVGPTGAGKSTIANLLMRFYETDSGEILIDGIPTRRMPRNYVHSLFCMVMQDSWLFPGTIRENIVYAKKDVSDETVRAACRAVEIETFVESLPQGLDTPVGDTDELSAGQRQQLALARALVKDAPMIILDEATSSVDTRTEQHIQRAMDRLTAGRTSFVIAHRLSTIVNADLILVVRDGNVVEKGTHQELLKAHGFYRDLFDSQFADCN